MEQGAGQSSKRKTWLIVFITSLFVLAVFWSVDPSVVYLVLGVAAFSLYKTLVLNKPGNSQKDYQNRSSFWDEVRKVFDKSSPGGSRSEQQTKNQVSFVISGLVGLVTLIIILSALFSEDPADRAAELRQQASDFYNLGQYDSALYFYRRAIRYEPENPDLHLERGNAFLNAGDTDSAMMAYNQVLTLEPAYKEAYYNKAIIYYNRKNYTNAIKETKRALQTDPDYIDALLLTGDSFYTLGQYDSAMVWYEGAYGQGYRSAVLSHIMAYVHDTKGRTDKAIALYKEALELDPNRTEIYTRLGELVGGEEGNLYRQKAVQQ